MKEFLVVLSMLFGMEQEQPVNNDVLKEEQITDGKFQYDVPENAPWWGVVRDNDIDSQTAQEGSDGEITTVWGNGTQGQGELTMDNPRKLQRDSKGNLYFIDGNQRTAKLRMFDGQKNKTVVDLSNDEIADKWGQFYASGLAIINNTIYVGSNEGIYKVVDGHLEVADEKIKSWMKDNRYETIYRMEPDGKYLYMLLMGKSYYYNMVRYDTETREIEQMMNEQTYPSPYNFHVYDGGKEFFLATDNGYVIWETLFPRQTKTAIEMGDPNTEVLDVWTDKDGALYFSVVVDQVYSKIYKDPLGEEEPMLVAGDRRGFVDAIQAGAEMDHATDFIWDGTGWLFTDMGNHAIRKLWMKQ